MPSVVGPSPFQQRCYETLPLVAYVNNYWVRRQSQSELNSHPEADVKESQESIYSQPTQTALKVAVITNILLIGIPRLLLSVTEYFEQGARGTRPNGGPLDRPFCACMLVACKISSGALSIVPSIILYLFNKIKENRQESTPLLSDTTESTDPDLSAAVSTGPSGP